MANKKRGNGSRERNVMENYGGDVVKAESTERLEKEGTFTGVHIHFGVGTEEGHPDENLVVKEAWQSKKYGFATIKALAVNYGKAIDAGTLEAGKRCPKCADYVSGDINTLETLEMLVHSAVEYALTRPITKEEAGESVSFAIAELEKQAGMNNRVDFTELVTRLDELKAKNIDLAFSNSSADFRSVMEEADAIVLETHNRVVANLTAGCRELAVDLGGDMVTKVEAEITKAMGLPALYQTIGALASCRRTLRANGAKYASQRADERAATNGRGNRSFIPRTGRGQGRGTHGGGRFQQTRGAHY